MSRRDTILFAVLINVGLLVVLFVTAMKPEAESSGSIVIAPTQQEKSQTEQNNDVVVKEDVTNNGSVDDEVDQLLNQLSSRSYRDIEKKPQKVEQEPKDVVSEDFIEIKVKRGDVLGRIAKANGVTVEDIMKANDLSSSRLNIGQVLKIPVKSKEVAIVAEEEEVNISAEDVKYYTVRSGDNPWLIALRHRIDLQELLRLNNLDEEKARRLKPGDKLRVH